MEKRDFLGFSTETCGKLSDKKSEENFTQRRNERKEKSKTLTGKFSSLFTFHFSLFISQLSALFGFLQVVESLLQNRAGAFAAVHFADIAFAHHRV